MIREKANIPDLDEAVYVKELSGKQLLAYYEKIAEVTTNKGMTPSNSLELACLLISMSVVGEDGNAIYTADEASDLPFRVINLLAGKALEISGLKEAKDNLKNE